MRQITVLVEQMLQQEQKYRDSDKELIIAVLDHMGMNLTPEQREILKSVNFESIRRYRQKLQEEGKYSPSVSVGKRRKLKSMIIEQNAPTAKPVYLDDLITTQPDPLQPTPKAISWLEPGEKL